jgi:thiol:disulfide interchange protein
LYANSNSQLKLKLRMSARCVDCLNEAVERCEVTGVPLCAQHLWYAEDGRRVSERVAKQLSIKGLTVHPPETYLQALGSSAALPRLPESPQPVITKQRNGNDVIALLSLITGISSLVTCFGIGIAMCVPPLPLLPLLLGSIGLAGAKNASKPDQARLFSWIGIVGGAGFIAVVLLLVVGSVAFGTTSLIPSLYSGGFATPTPAP